MEVRGGVDFKTLRPCSIFGSTNAFSDSITFNLFVDLFKGFCVPDSFQRRTVPYICE